MKSETLVDLPESLRTRLVSVDDLMQKIEDERNRSLEFLQETIFPNRIRELSRRINSSTTDTPALEIWEEAGVSSGIIALFSDIQYEGLEEDERGKRDTYTASAICVEMLPTGVVILRGETSLGHLLLTQKEWRGNEQIQQECLSAILDRSKRIWYEIPVVGDVVYC